MTTFRCRQLEKEGADRTLSNTFLYTINCLFSQVDKSLMQYLTESEFADYDHFIKMKAKLVMDAREIADKIKLGEEQMTALRETFKTLPDVPTNS